MKRGNYRSSSLTDLISAFDTKANSHTALQKVTAFSGQFDKNIKPTFSKEEYGKPIPGSMTEFRGAEAQARVCSEMKELCSIIHDYGKSPCKSLLPPELQDATKVISFGELFSLLSAFYPEIQRVFQDLILPAVPGTYLPPGKYALYGSVISQLFHCSLSGRLFTDSRIALQSSITMYSLTPSKNGGGSCYFKREEKLQMGDMVFMPKLILCDTRGNGLANEQSVDKIFTILFIT
ncbi:hypothetical protein MSG28_012264 [Choristoneura fumiferana]|uniref:Uncharacterized protein n=1 Tax=Choristoneura fumiferana TaxID=7141 RepID=A0ACC0KCF3_CHOFU|nr:hypothetical protein MSG28_012264 [Choristoneura fumiferana]